MGINLILKYKALKAIKVGIFIVMFKFKKKVLIKVTKYLIKIQKTKYSKFVLLFFLLPEKPLQFNTFLSIKL